MELHRSVFTRTILLLALASPPLMLPAISLATPTVTIVRVEDQTDMRGGPWSLPPTEPSPPNAIPAEPYPDDPPAIPEGYVTDRSRHRSADLYIEVDVANATPPVVVSLDWLGVNNPDGGIPSSLGTMQLQEVPGSGGARYSITTGSPLPPRTCGLFYSFDIHVTDATSSVTQQWEKRAPGSTPTFSRRWVQLGCTDPDWEKDNPDNLEDGQANGYRSYYLRLGSHTSDIPTDEYDRVDRYRHDSGTDGGHYDTGALIRELPGNEVEQRSCSQYLVYWFDQSVSVNGLATIGNAYYHLWFSRCNSIAPGASVQRTRGWLAGTRPDLGVGGLFYRPPTYYWNGNAGHHELYVNPVYSLATGSFDIASNSGVTNTFSGNSIYEMYLRLDAAAGYPSCITSRRNPSFICFNVPPAILNGSDTTTDTDKDGLPDTSELLAAFTSPFLQDTDADGLSDLLEWNGGAGGVAPNDPCNLHVNYPNNAGLKWTIGNNVTITFNPVPPGCSEARLYIKRGASGAWQELTTAPLAVGATSFAWQVTGPAANQCWIKEAFDAADPGDPCDNSFEIKTSTGCPFLYTNQNGRWTELNTILAAVPADEAGKPESDVVDRFVLSNAPTVEDGEYRFEIREFESERSWIDGVQLDVVDHPADTELGVTEKGELFLFGNGVAPDKAVDGHGVDRLADVMVADQRVFNGRTGDILYLEYPAAADGVARRIKLITANKPPLESGSADHAVASVGRGIRVAFDPPEQSTPLTDMLVEPRENLGPKWLDIPVSTGEPVGSTNRIRVKLEWGSDHPLDFAGLVAPIEAQLEVKNLALTRAMGQDGTPLIGSLDIAASGDGPTILNPGGKIGLAFRANLTEATGRRDFVFTSRGHYAHIEAANSASPPPAGLNLAVTPLAAGSAGAEIAFSIDRADDVRIDIFSVSGRLVRTLSQGRLEAGRHAIVWDGRDANNQKVGAGIYFCQVKASQQSDSGRVAIAR